MSGFIESGEIFKLRGAIKDRRAFAELFSKFYALSKEADAAHRTNPEKWTELNTVAIPAIMEAIIKMIAPDPSTIKIVHPVLDPKS